MGLRAGRAVRDRERDLLGAERVIAIDRFPYRLRMARDRAGAAEILNYEEVDVREALDTLTGGRGPDPASTRSGWKDTHLARGRLRQSEDDADARNGSPGSPASGDPLVPQRRNDIGCRRLRRLHRQVPDGRHRQPIADDPLGANTRAPLHAAAARAHSQRADRSGFVITHRMRLDDAPEAYEIFNNKEDECLKVVLTP